MKLFSEELSIHSWIHTDVYSLTQRTSVVHEEFKWEGNFSYQEISRKKQLTVRILESLENTPSFPVSFQPYFFRLRRGYTARFHAKFEKDWVQAWIINRLDWKLADAMAATEWEFVTSYNCF